MEGIEGMSGTTTSRPADRDLNAEARGIVAELKRAVAAGETNWFLALMQAVRDWPLAQETIGDRTYRYLVGGEAFDWLPETPSEPTRRVKKK